MGGRAVLALSMAALAEAQTCALTSKEPEKARYLKFCQDYNSKACCIPGHDLENQVQFENAIDGLGPGCKNPMMYPELRYFYCLGCDPDQPSYTDETTDPPTIRVCNDFVDRLWKDPAYNDCGIMFPNPCPESWGYDGFDPYTCGDDLLLPTVTASWQDITGIETEPTGIQFMNVFKPPGLEDYQFVNVSNQTAQGACFQPKAFRNSAARMSRAPGLAVMLLGMLLPAALQRLR